MDFKLLMGGIVVTFHCGFFNGTVHALDLAIGPGMFNSGEAMLDAVFMANPIKDMYKSVCIGCTIGKLDSILRENMGDFVRHGSHKMAEEVSSDLLCLVFMQFDVSKL